MSKKNNCDYCGYSSNSWYDFNTHLSTNKHRANASGQASHQFHCTHCLKEYSCQSSCYKHQKICSKRLRSNNINIKHEVALTKALTEFNMNVQELKRPVNIINNITNNIINVNLFLTDNIKPSIGFTDMIKQIVIDKKFCSGIYFASAYAEKCGNEIKKHFEQISIADRPIYCVEGEEQHQKVLHIHHDNKWLVERDNKIYRDLNSASEATLEKEFEGVGIGKFLHDMDRECIKQISELYAKSSKQLKERVIRQFKLSSRQVPQKMTLVHMLMEIAHIDKTQLNLLKLETKENNID